jgi:acetylornithine deacetylase
MSNTVPSLLEMIHQLVATPSVSCTLDDWDMSNRPVIDLLANWLNELGFEVEVLPVPGYAGKYNLIATLGSGSGGLILSGHTDTVPYNAEKWQSDPFKITERNDKLYGLGTCDMKAFFALAIEASRAYLQTPLKAPLILLATADEESSMSGAQALAAAGKPKARYAVIGEPTGLKPIRMHKGIMMEGIKVTGKAGHSSNPALGVNAMEGMHRVLGELIQYRGELQNRYQNASFAVSVPTLNLGCIHGGDNPNRICGQCELEYDLRPLPGMDMDALREDIQARMKPIASELGVDIECGPIFTGVPSFETPVEAELVQTAERLTGHPSQAVAFATEAPFLSGMGIETLVMGPGSIDQAHQPDEYLALDQIKPTVELLSQLIERYCVHAKA